MSKKDLLARAKELGIKGRHDMSSADLETAVKQREMIAQVSDAAKRASDEVRGKRGRGNNLNEPWRRKYYYVSLPVYEQTKAERKPMQVQLLLKFMVERGIVSPANSEQGGAIASVAIASGYLKTVIEPHVLFAYYRKKMEAFGLIFAGYDRGDDEGDGDSEEELDAAAEREAEAELEPKEEDADGE